MTNPQSRDTGLQPERTSLSFARTGLSIFGVVVICLRWLPAYNPTTLVAPAIAGALVSGALICEHRARALRITRFELGSAPPAIAMGASLAVSVVLLSISGLWILLW